MSQIRTAYILGNLDKCKRCWVCIKVCNKQVIGKVGSFWNKRIIFKNAENCTGCKKCIKVCPCEVFVEIKKSK